MSIKRLAEIGVRRVTLPRMLPAAAIHGMTRALEAMKEVIASGEPADRPDLLVDIDAIMRLMDYDAMRELERRLLSTEALEAKYGTAGELRPDEAPRASDFSQSSVCSLSICCSRWNIASILARSRLPRQQHELLLELGLIEGTLRRSLEAGDPPRELAPVLEPDSDGVDRILALWPPPGITLMRDARSRMARSRTTASSNERGSRASR